MKVSLIIIAKDEEKYLPILLDSILDQSYTRENIEIILVDAMSSDLTNKIMLDFQEKYQSQFANIQIAMNDKITQSSGRNLGMKLATSELIFHLDAHSVADNFYIENAVNHYNEGAKAFGGPVERISLGNSFKEQLLMEAENAMFGSGIGAHRNETMKVKEVKTVSQIVLAREVVDKVGYYNEEYLRAEDNDYSYRIRENGNSIYYYPDIRSKYYVRSKLSKMISQKYGNGFWVGYCAKINHKMFSLYHFIPIIFLFLSFLGMLLLGVSVGLSFINWKFIFLATPTFMLFALYFIFSLMSSILSVIKKRNISYLAIIFIFPMLHYAYGIGTFMGILKKRKGIE